MAEPISDPIDTGQEPLLSASDGSLDHPESLPASSVEPDSGSLHQTLEAILADGLAAIRDELAAKLTYDRFKEQQVERLHAELQEYKGDLLRRATEPLFYGLIKLHDHLSQLLDRLFQEPREELVADKLLGYLDEFRDDVALLLGHHGVEPFSVPEEAFDPRRQTAVVRCPVEDPSLSGQIAARVRSGFELGDVVLQRERVAVFVTVPAATPSPSNSQEPGSQEDKSR